MCTLKVVEINNTHILVRDGHPWRGGVAWHSLNAIIAVVTAQDGRLINHRTVHLLTLLQSRTTERYVRISRTLNTKPLCYLSSLQWCVLLRLRNTELFLPTDRIIRLQLTSFTGSSEWSRLTHSERRPGIIWALRLSFTVSGPSSWLSQMLSSVCEA